jgi:predicted PhzF superfamily epimerase YddE/YHI9
MGWCFGYERSDLDARIAPAAINGGAQHLVLVLNSRKRLKDMHYDQQAGYLRDIGWPHHGMIDIVQGEDMGSRSRLRAEIPEQKGSSIRVSGMVRKL